MREAGKRTYVKMYPHNCLHGSIRYQLDAAERGVWYELIYMSALCAEPGTVSDNDKRPYPHDFIANRLNIDEELLESTLKKCKEEGRISEDEHGIHITNWGVYQSEYQRQKPYRDAKKLEKKSPKWCRSCDYRALTNEEYCPKCAEKGKTSLLEKDYKAQKLGHMVKS